MYHSKALLPAQGSIQVKVLFELRNGKQHIEFGYSQSNNVLNRKTKMLKEAVINALYRLNNRLGESIIKGSDSTIDIYIERQIINSYEIIDYKISYYEDRVYSFKRVNIEGEHIYLIKKNDKIEKGVPATYLKDAKLRDFENNF